jgi:hypothetical protein
MGQFSVKISAYPGQISVEINITGANQLVEDLLCSIGI